MGGVGWSRTAEVVQDRASVSGDDTEDYYYKTERLRFAEG